MLPKHGGDRNRTSPFAFTGNKFEFRALGSSQSISLTNTVLNTIAASAIDDLAGQLAPLLDGGSDINEAVLKVVKDAYTAHKRIVFNGDGYTEEWEKEAADRGLLNLRTTPDALPYLVKPETVALFERYSVLNERELEAREEVLTEQYVIKLNIEGETTAQIARTMILPAAVRHLAELKAAGNEALIGETDELLKELFFAIDKLEGVNEIHRDDTIHEEAAYMRDEVIPAMASVREVADKLEKIIADDLWPLPSTGRCCSSSSAATAPGSVGSADRVGPVAQPSRELRGGGADLDDDVGRDVGLARRGENRVRRRRLVQAVGAAPIGAEEREQPPHVLALVDLLDQLDVRRREVELLGEAALDHVQRHGQMLDDASPWRWAKDAASVRLEQSVLRRMLRMWLAAVCSLIASSLPISLLLRPRATSARICASRAESPLGSATGASRPSASTRAASAVSPIRAASEPASASAPAPARRSRRRPGTTADDGRTGRRCARPTSRSPCGG